MPRFDCQLPERIGDVIVSTLRGGPGNHNAWLRVAGRPGHNRAMVWVNWTPEVTAGLVSYWAGVPNPFDVNNAITFGELPGTRVMTVEVFPSAHTGAQTGTAAAVAMPLSLPPGADVGVLLSGLVFAHDPPVDPLATVWWTSWIEAE